MLPSSPWMPLFRARPLPRLSNTNVSSPKANPSVNDWIVWRIIEPDSSLLHKGKDKLLIGPGDGGSQDGVRLSEMPTTYKSLALSSMQEWGWREKEMTGLGWECSTLGRASTQLQRRISSAIHAKKNQSPTPRGMTGINTYWFLEGTICFPGICQHLILLREPIGVFSDSKG